MNMQCKHGKMHNPNPHKTLRNHIDRSVFAMKLSCFLILLINLEMFLQLHWSPPEVNSVDWTGCGDVNTFYMKPHSSLSEHKPKQEV